ncbi:MAG: zinc-dependent metalloprotease [Gemmatimonadaceae bacterium]
MRSTLMHPTIAIVATIAAAACATTGQRTTAATAGGAVAPRDTSVRPPTPVPQATSAQAGAAARPQGAAPADPNARKTIADATRSSRKYEGLFTVYQDTTTGSLHMLVPKATLDKEFIYFTHTVDAPVTAGRFRGAFGDNNVFTIRRHFNRLEFVTQNTRHWFDASSPLARASSANISPATVSVQDIVASDSVAYLVKADDLFLTEALTQIKPSAPPTPPPTPQFSLGSLSKAKSRVVAVRNYPVNTDVVVEYVYENPAPVVRGGPDVTDARNVTVTLQHSLIALPQNDYQPRFDDPRVGYFTEETQDMLSPSSTPYRDLINRWKLVKRDPSAAISEPVEPIVWWIENTTPVEFRDAIAEGVLRWNEAFEAAGFRNALQVRIQPDTATWDAGDMRYNVLRWTSSPNPPFGGYGPSFTNPRTGQILGADIMLEYVYVTNRVRYERLFPRAGLDAVDEDIDLQTDDPSRFCTYGRNMQYNLMLGRAALEARGASELEVREMVRQSLIELTMHEVGHTLGLNHNMKASQAVSASQVHDRSFTERHGTMGSVMDYSAINVAPPGRAQGQYYMTKAGPYDVWAIQFGYTPSLADPAAERARVESLLARSTEPQLVFGNDADDMRASGGGGIDPRVNIGDMSSDAIGYAVDRFATVDELMGRLLAKYARPGQSYHEMRTAYLILSGQQAAAANVVSRYIGGVYVNRAMVGQPGAGRPFTPVSRDEQKRAMRTLAQHVFAPDAFRTSDALYAHLAMQRRGFAFFGTPEDPKIHERALTIQRGVLNHLMSPRLLTRITDTRLYGNEYPLVEVMSDLTNAIFAADARGNVNTFRQQLQLEYVNRLIAMITPGPRNTYDYQTQSAALANLRSIDALVRGKTGVNAETAAHGGHVLFAIEKALKTD